ncbi:MAG: glycerophosphodiester phosphodiesterase [Clostridia bacterium]|nr:glycerophosphodiester phosphodiesterase [Clostridia bacterium]
MNVLIISGIVIFTLAILYVLAVMPRTVYNRRSKEMANTLFAHRGLHNNDTIAPENSMKAFEKAVEAGFGIECDVQLTKDHIPVIFHDFSLKRICAKEGKISDYTYDELKNFSLCRSEEHIPRLNDLLQLVRGRVPLLIELKIEFMDLKLCEQVDKLMRDYNGIYYIESFNPLALFWYRKNHNDVLRGQLSDGFHRESIGKAVICFLVENLFLNGITKPDFIAYNHRYAKNINRRMCRKLFRNTAVAWTIKSEEELERASKEFDVFIFDSFRPQKNKKGA